MSSPRHAVVRCLCSLTAAQTLPETPAGRLVVDWAVPESPTFTVLGLTPHTVTRPSHPHELATALLNGIDQNGNLQAGIALDVASYMLAYGRKVTWSP